MPSWSARAGSTGSGFSAGRRELATELDAAWFIHHDADEFRESPWSHLSLKRRHPARGCAGLQRHRFRGARLLADPRRLPRRRRCPGQRSRSARSWRRTIVPQMRCWKKTDSLDLASSGGHDARFTGRRVFPLRFILRHYPIRGQAHGDRKVFQERRNRFLDRRARQGLARAVRPDAGGRVLSSRSGNADAYDPDALRRSLTLHPRYPEELEEALREARSEVSAIQSETDALRRENETASAHIEHVTAQLVQIREELHIREKQAALFRSGLEQRTAQVAARRRRDRPGESGSRPARRGYRAMAGRGGWPDAPPRPARALAQLAVDRPGSRSVSCPQGTMTPEVYLVLIEFGQEPERAALELLRPDPPAPLPRCECSRRCRRQCSRRGRTHVDRRRRSIA